MRRAGAYSQNIVELVVFRHVVDLGEDSVKSMRTKYAAYL